MQETNYFKENDTCPLNFTILSKKNNEKKIAK